MIASTEQGEVWHTGELICDIVDAHLVNIAYYTTKMNIRLGFEDYQNYDCAVYEPLYAAIRTEVFGRPHIHDGLIKRLSFLHPKAILLWGLSIPDIPPNTRRWICPLHKNETCGDLMAIKYGWLCWLGDSCGHPLTPAVGAWKAS